MSQIIDRRLNGKNKSAVNRQRFIRRFKKQIKEAVSHAISKRSITDIYKGEKVTIPRKDLSEPVFRHGRGGEREIVFPGNKEFIKGDLIKRPPQGAGEGESTASNEGEGMDEFSFELSKEEFINLFFDDLELPDLVKTKLHETPTYEYVKAGYSTVGTPPNINLVRSFRNAIGRRRIFKKSYKKKLAKLEDELAAINAEPTPDIAKRKQLEADIELYKKKIGAVPFLDEFDIRYNTKVKRSAPSSSAVMFCIMDVSGSMDEAKKEMAKRFFILLYLFLTRKYEKIDLVFIRHHTTAKEVDEHEFFYSRETGGTVVSSALEKMKYIIQERYPTNDWNIYVAQASDGDNWNADSPICQDILLSEIMPYVQYYAYVEIMPRHHQSLWRSYTLVRDAFKNFAMQNIKTPQEIYPVFHELFKRR